jgi:YidC/Oxa1 family membrane protein insertase
MERRVLLAVFLSFLVLMAYQTFVVKPRTKPQAGPRDVTGAQLPVGGAQGPQAQTPAAPDVALESGPRGAGSTVVTGDDVERDIVVDMAAVRAVFSNRGGVLKSWKLKRYFDSTGAPIDILPSALQATERRPFSLTVGDAALTTTVNGALYKPSTGSLNIGTQGGTLGFEFRNADGVHVKKTFELQPEGHTYVVRVDVTVTAWGQAQRFTVNGGSGFGDFERGVQPSGFFATSTYQVPQAIFQEAADVHRVHVTPGQTPVHEGTFRYAGVDDHYFLAALLPGDRRARVEYHGLTVPSAAGPRNLVDYRVRVAGVGPMRFYYGPKEFDILQSVDPELVRTIHFGIFGFLATPLLKSLKWVDGYVGNYGWSIILLTVIINLLMFPLRHKSAVSMRKMQEIQPQVKAIQDRYAKLKVTDPARQKMNTELMNLYRERGVNPASGCVPMLLTFPVLFAFYALLSVAIELRGAPWVGWIKDLSTYDPLFITPILMGASQFWQTRMMPTTGDPTQQKMMMFMPLIFLVFFLWAPSGLVIYWLVSNLWTIGQQYLTNRMLGGPPAAGSRPSADRRKKIGNSRLEGEAAV